MTRTSASGLALGTALALLSSVPFAAAQTAGTGGTSTTTGGGTVTWLLTTIGDEKYTDTSYMTPVNAAQCAANAELHLSLTGIPTGTKYLEVWVGDKCDAGNRATRIGETPPCEHVKFKEQDTTVTADTDFTIPVGPACMLGDGKRSYYILPVMTLMGSDTISPFALVTLPYDQTPPSAPTSVKGGAGQTEISVSWKQPSDTFFFWVVADTNVGAAAGVDAGSDSCASATLRDGDEFDPDISPLPDGIWVRHITEKASSTTLSADDLGISEGEAAVAVIAEDRGHNRSVLSNVACIHVVPTVGFWDSYKGAGGSADAGCACTALGAQRHAPSRFISALVVAGAVLTLRRRSRRRA